MKQTFGLLILLVAFLSCSSNPTKTAKSMEPTDKWVTYHDTIESHFIMTFKYPDNLVFADILDNCRCVGRKLEYKKV